MHARVFRRITHSFSTISKTTLLALFLFATVFGIVSSAFAQTPEEIITQRQLAYQNYLNLFTPDSGLVGTVGLTRDNTNDVIGIKFNISLNTNKPGDPWEYVKEDGTTTQPNADDVFLIRLCNTDNQTQCWVNTVPYSEDADGYNYNLIAREYGKGPNLDEPVRSQSISNFSGFDYNHRNAVNVSSGLSGYRHKYARDITGTKNEGTISAYEPTRFQKGRMVEATLWYCAANVGKETGGSAYDGNGLNDTVATFGTLCGGDSYFRIGQPQRITIPSTDEAVAALVNTNPSTKQVSDPVSEDNLPTCEITSGYIIGCFARLVYYGLYWPMAWVAGLFGSLFDFFIGYSVSDESYRYAFAVNGWKLVRDIANIMFIVIMVYVGFSAVFSFGGSTMRKVIPVLIINALIINFSLFATRTVIDVSNITARVFYSRMIVCDGKCEYKDGNSTPINVKRGLGGHWPLSEKIVSAFDPQKMFGTKLLNSKETPTGSANPSDPFTSTNSSDAGQKAEQGKGFGPESSEYAGYYALVSIIAAAIMLGIAAMFFNVTFMFVGRVIGLYMAMIFSPFAFLTRGGMPLFKIDGYTWDSWTKDLFQYAALAPVFTFFLYIVYSFLNTDIVKQIGVEDTTGGFFGTVLSIVIPMLFIYLIISKGVSVAKRYAGKFGEGVQNFVGGITGNVASLAGGAAIGVASGGAALLGTRAAAVFKTSGATRTALMAQQAQGGFGGAVARARLGMSDWSQKQTFDLRKTQALQSASKTLGINTNNKLVTTLGFGEDRVKGGSAGMIKRAESETKTKIDTVKSDLKDGDAGAFWENHISKRVEKEAEKEYFAELKLAGKTNKELSELKKSKSYKTEKPYTDHAEKVREGLNKSHGKVTNNKQLTQALRTEYAETILKSKKSVLGGVNPEATAARAAATVGVYGAAGLATMGGVLGATLVAGGNTERKGVVKAAQDFLDTQKKAIKKPVRADRLSEENKNHQKDIEDIEKIFETIPGYAAVKDNPREMKDVVDKYRENLRNEYDQLDLEVKKINAEYEAAAAKGDDFTANMKKKQQFAAITDRNAKQKQYNDLDPKNIRDLRDKVNRNDAELEKIKEKEDKSSSDSKAKESGGDDKKK